MMWRGTILLLMFGFVVVGCSDQPAPPQKHPGDDVLKDPMGYKPSMEDPNISGGGLFHLDKKGLKKDTDSVLNP